MGRFRSNSLIIQILVLFISFNIISLIVFTFYVFERDNRYAIQNAERNLQEIIMERANLISMQLDSIADETEELACWTEEYLREERNSGAIESSYQMDQSGAVYRSGEDAHRVAATSFFVPSGGEMTGETIRQINATEHLTPFFQRLHQRRPEIKWSYISTEDGLIRCYPASDMSVFMPNHQQSGDLFYQVANPKNNPGRKSVWTEPYVDFLGTGWLVSNSHPIYLNGDFVGVASIDINLKTIQQEYVPDFQLGHSEAVYLLDTAGNIVYNADFMPANQNAGATFATNIITDTGLTHSHKNALKKMLEGGEKTGLIRYTEGKEWNKRTIVFARVEGMPWILSIEMDQADYMATENLKLSNLLFFIAVIFVAGILCAAFLYKRYSSPIFELVDRAHRIADGNFEAEEGPNYYYIELNTLSETFNIMSLKIKSYTDKLIEKNREIETILNSIGGLLMILSPKGKLLMVNERGNRLIQERGNGRKGTFCYEALMNRQEACPQCRLLGAVREGKPIRTRLTIGQEIYSNEYYPVLDENGTVGEVVVYSRRITNRVYMEKELAQAEKMAGIGQLSSAIAHELKNPLAVIKGYAYLLEVYAKEDKLKSIIDAVQTISDTVDEAENVIQTLLNFSSRSPQEDCEIDVSMTVEQILLLYRRDVIRKNVEITLRFEPSPLLFYGTAEPMKHVLQNLIGNAVYAVKSGGRIIIEGTFSEENGRALELTVFDEGPEVPAELRDKIFHPFFTTKGAEGTGLGLWVTKIMVEKMSGQISLIDTDGMGAAFLIRLPESTAKGGRNELQ